MIGNAQAISQWLWLQDREKLFEIKEHKAKRTNTQNSYLWALVNQMANKLNKTKEEIYIQMIRDYGQSEIVSMLSSIEPNGYFKYYEEIGTGIVNEKEFTHYRIYKGSSEYNTLEMAHLLDGVIQECEQLGIPTLTMEQIQQMRLI